MNAMKKAACTALLLFSFRLTFAQAVQDSGSVTWIEGKRVTRLTIISDEVAEIQTDEKSALNADAPAAGNAVVLTAKNRIRIWKITGDGAFMSRLFSGSGGGSYSQVFVDASGRKRALPGNIVVFMKKEMSEDDVLAWARKKNLTVIRMISRYSNSYLVRTGPGMEALTLSNSLNGDEAVIVSTPNWWTDVSPR